MEVYHGTNTIVEKPEVRIAGYAKDFGYGFYCTKLERQAQRWAVTKRTLILFVFTNTPLPQSLMLSLFLL